MKFYDRLGQPMTLEEWTRKPYRYATEEQALAGHTAMVTTVKTMLDVAADGGAEEPARAEVEHRDG